MGFWNRLFGRNPGREWEREEQSPDVAREAEFERESVDDRANRGFVEEHLGVPPGPRDDDA